MVNTAEGDKGNTRKKNINTAARVPGAEDSSGRGWVVEDGYIADGTAVRWMRLSC